MLSAVRHTIHVEVRVLQLDSTRIALEAIHVVQVRLPVITAQTGLQAGALDALKTHRARRFVSDVVTSRAEWLVIQYMNLVCTG